MSGESPAGNGLGESQKPCQDCHCEIAVIDFRGESYCQCCLATRGVFRAPWGEAEIIVASVRDERRAAAAVQVSRDAIRKRKQFEEAKALAMVVSAAGVRKQVDSARLMKRGVTSNGRSSSN